MLMLAHPYLTLSLGRSAGSTPMSLATTLVCLPLFLLPCFGDQVISCEAGSLWCVYRTRGALLVSDDAVVFWWKVLVPYHTVLYCHMLTSVNIESFSQ